MEAAIIGHGPSLLGEDTGEAIDRYDFVVRIKRSKQLIEQHPEIYGTRTDAALGSLTLGRVMVDHWGEELPIWLFNDTRTETAKNVSLPPTVHLDTQLCKNWREKYREIRSNYRPAGSQVRCGHLSDEKGHRHPSAGFHAIMYALNLLKPDQVCLFGFDNLLSGVHDWSVTRGTLWDKYPDHNWPAERVLLDQLCDYYKYSIELQQAKGEAILYAV